MDLKKNADGSVDIFCGPKAPKGLWATGFPPSPVATGFSYFRLYEPPQPYFDWSWPLGDFEEIKGKGWRRKQEPSRDPHSIT